MHAHTHINVTTAKWHQETTIYLVWVNASLHECKMEQSHLQGNVQSECNCCSHHLGVTESKKRLWVWWTWTWEYQNDWERHKTKTALFKDTNRAAYYYSASIITWPWLFVSICVLHNRPDSDQMFPCKPPWIAHMVSDCSHTLHSPQPLLHSAPTMLTSCTREKRQGTCLWLSVISTVSPRGWWRLTVSFLPASYSNKGTARPV